MPSHARDAEDKADGVQDIALPASIQAGDGVETRIKADDGRLGRVRLEAIKDDLHKKHGGEDGRALGAANKVADRLASEFEFQRPIPIHPAVSAVSEGYVI